MSLDQDLMKLLNDPKLMKELQRLSKEAGKENARKKITKQDTVPSFVNHITEKCKLCASETESFIRMDWDPNDRIYRSGGYAWKNIWPEDFPLRKITQHRPCCNNCAIALKECSTEELVNKLICLSNKLYMKP